MATKKATSAPEEQSGTKTGTTKPTSKKTEAKTTKTAPAKTAAAETKPKATKTAEGTVEKPASKKTTAAKTEKPTAVKTVAKKATTKTAAEKKPTAATKASAEKKAPAKSKATAAKNAENPEAEAEALEVKAVKAAAKKATAAKAETAEKKPAKKAVKAENEVEVVEKPKNSTVKKTAEPKENETLATAKKLAENLGQVASDTLASTVEAVKKTAKKAVKQALAAAEELGENINIPNPYADRTQEELVAILADRLDTQPVQTLRTDVEAIKVIFYKHNRTVIEEQKAAFLAAGGTEETFEPSENPLEKEFKNLLASYREKRDTYIQQTEKEKEKAYKEKLSIIEELKNLVDSNETVGKTFNAFRELQQRWKDAGIVPQEQVKELWNTYHHHVENFYNYIKINKELRDLDLKKNYEAKLALAEEAEALMLDPSVADASRKLQRLHEQWRETGPVAIEVKDQLWERFKQASAQINKRHQEYFEGQKEEQMQNLALKTGLCVKVEEIAEGVYTTPKAWNDAMEQILEIQKVWKTIGFAPKKDNTKIYERFRAACDKFFEAKRSYYSEAKSEANDHLQAKLDLCVQAEALQDSDQWKETTDAFIELQKKWKETGAVSRKYADQVWKRFRAAADRFFERKSAHFGDQDSKFAENLERKQNLLARMSETAADPASVTFDKIKEYQRQWAEIGFVPAKQKEVIQNQYREIVDTLFGILRGEEGARHMQHFRDRVGRMQEGGGKRVNAERDRLYTRLKQLENDVQIWENNIGFFAHSKNAESLLQDVRNKIDRAKEQIAELIEKIKLIDNPTTATLATEAKIAKKEAEEGAAEPVIEATTIPEGEPTPESEIPTEETEA